MQWVSGTALRVKDFGATGDGVTDNTQSIQGAIDYLFTNFGGGILSFPPGNFYTSFGVTLKGGVVIQGSGAETTMISSGMHDSTVITFDTSCHYAGLEKMFVVGQQNISATKDTVVVANNIPVTIRDCLVWAGRNALNNAGVDGVIENCYLSGVGNANVYSTGSNWYSRCKINQPSLHLGYGFYQGPSPSSSIVENHFTQCDFSGNFGYSLYIDDGPNFPGTAVTVFEGCVISSPIKIANAKWTNLSNCEIGSQSLEADNGVCTIHGCFGFGFINPVGNATFIKNANYNIA